jgi:anthranilate synthase component II
MRLLIVDNYDSFTYNLYQLLSEAGCKDITLIKNDKLDISQVAAFDKIVFSPGPGIPAEVSILGEILSEFQQSKSILGVCLGHQAIGCFYGAKLVNLLQLHHGISSILKITDTHEKLFYGISRDIIVGRYHSWVIEEATMPVCLSVTSKTNEGYIMSIAHRQYDIKGVQFHPESYITTFGNKLMYNWLKT